MALGTWKEEWTVNRNEEVKELIIRIIFASICFGRKGICTLFTCPNRENCWWSFAHDGESRYTNRVLGVWYKPPDNIRQLFSGDVSYVLILGGYYLKSTRKNRFLLYNQNYFSQWNLIRHINIFMPSHTQNSRQTIHNKCNHFMNFKDSPISIKKILCS